MPYATLPDRGLLVLHGEETLPFLQGLVSNDVLGLREAGIVYTALLTPQGKFLHDFFVMQYGESVLIDCDASRLPDLRQRLIRYRLRSKIAIEAMPDAFGVAALWSEQMPAPGEAISFFSDPRLPALGVRLIGDKDAVSRWCHSHHLKVGDYELLRLTLGVPQGGSDLIPEKSFILPFGFEDLHGVNFTKGCYVGQEVTARSKHLAQIRKFIYRVRSVQGPLPPSGTSIYRGDSAAGELRSAQGGLGLALLSVEEVEKSAQSGVHLRAGDVPIQATLPEWVTLLNR